jgi:hypothetical protein
MSRFSHDHLPDELRDVVELLSDERPTIGALELDDIKLRARARAARKPAKGPFMKSRLAILAVLAVGLLMSGAGASLAVSGLLSTRSASIAQYGTTTTTAPAGTTTTTGVVPNVVTTTTTTTTTTTPTTDEVPEDDTLAEEEDEATETPAQAVQPARQVAAAKESELPFTGYAAIPVLLLGLAFLGLGLGMRRRAARDATS